ALVVEDVNIALAEGWGDLVLGDLDARAVADDFVLALDRLDAADVDAQAGVEAQGAPAGGRLWVAEHHADLLAKLVGEQDGAVRLLDRAGQLAERLAHQPRLKAHVAVAHFTLKLRARHQRRDAVQHDHINRAAANQRVGDLQRLLAGIRLGDVEVVHIHAEPLRVDRVERVLHVDERAHAAHPLRLSDGVQAEGRLTGAFRSVNLSHPPAWDPPNADREIDSERSGRDDINLEMRYVAQADDGPVSISFRQLANRILQCFQAGLVWHRLISIPCFFGHLRRWCDTQRIAQTF